MRGTAALVRVHVEDAWSWMYEHSSVVFEPAFMPSTPPWMFSRRPVKLSPHIPSTVADGTATAISTSSIRMLVPELIRMTPAFEVVARPRTIERVTRTLLAAMIRKPWMSWASIVVPSCDTMTSPLTTVSVTPAGTPVFAAVGLLPRHDGAPPPVPPRPPAPAVPPAPPDPPRPPAPAVPPAPPDPPLPPAPAVPPEPPLPPTPAVPAAPPEPPRPPAPAVPPAPPDPPRPPAPAVPPAPPDPPLPPAPADPVVPPAPAEPPPMPVPAAPVVPAEPPEPVVPAEPPASPPEPPSGAAPPPPPHEAAEVATRRANASRRTAVTPGYPPTNTNG